jgi:hypothetical protein
MVKHYHKKLSQERNDWTGAEYREVRLEGEA